MKLFSIIIRKDCTFKQKKNLIKYSVVFFKAISKEKVFGGPYNSTTAKNRRTVISRHFVLSSVEFPNSLFHIHTTTYIWHAIFRRSSERLSLLLLFKNMAWKITYIPSIWGKLVCRTLNSYIGRWSVGKLRKSRRTLKPFKGTKNSLKYCKGALKSCSWFSLRECVVSEIRKKIFFLSSLLAKETLKGNKKSVFSSRR